MQSNLYEEPLVVASHVVYPGRIRDLAGRDSHGVNRVVLHQQLCFFFFFQKEKQRRAKESGCVVKERNFVLQARSNREQGLARSGGYFV